MESRKQSRRKYLTIVGSVGFAGLAGCSGNGDNNSEQPEDNETETQTQTDDDTQTEGDDNTQSENGEETQTDDQGEVETQITLPEELTVGEQFTGSVTIENSTDSSANIPEISFASEYGGQSDTLSSTESNQIPAGETIETELSPIVPLYAEDLTISVGSDESTKSVGSAEVNGQNFESDNGLSITVEPVSLYSSLLLNDTDDVYSSNPESSLLRVNISAEGWTSPTTNDHFFVQPTEQSSVRFLQENLSVATSEIDWPENPYQSRSETENGGWNVFEVPTQVLEEGINLGWNRNPDDGTTEEVIWRTTLSDGIQNVSQTSHFVNWPTFVHKNMEFDVNVDIENPTNVPYTFQASVSLSNLEDGQQTIDMDERVAPETTDQRTVATLSPSSDIETPGEIPSPGGGITVGPPRLAFGEAYNGLTLERADYSSPIEYETEDGYTVSSRGGGTFLRIVADGVSPAPEDFHAFDGNGDDTTGLDDSIHSGDVSRLIRPVEGEIYEQGDDSGWIVLENSSSSMEIDFMAAGWYPGTGESNIVDEMSARALWYTEELRQYQDEEEEDWWRNI